MFETQKVRVKDLAQRFLPGKARWYPKLRRYIKRLEVVLAEVGIVELVIIWKAQGYGWHLTTLISTLKAGVQEVFKAWSARWFLEVSHRLRKQNLALGSCQCLAYAAHVVPALPDPSGPTLCSTPNSSTGLSSWCAWNGSEYPA